jgi:peptidoglycan lytic transglycosylase
MRRREAELGGDRHFSALEGVERGMREALRQVRTATATIGTAALLAIYVGSTVRMEHGLSRQARSVVQEPRGAAALFSGLAGALLGRGEASHYGAEFIGWPTASGAAYDPGLRTAAHPTLPLGSRVQVTNLANGRSTVVTINDRGPFARGRVIDLSREAAQDIDMLGAGSAEVELRQAP